VGSSPPLERAYQLALQHHPHPNPRVGAVVVSATGEVVGEGAHEGPGLPHAEIVALDAARSARGSTLYVSLEPCAHHGRTPPCVDRIIAEGVSRVVVGTMDPDRQVAGAGLERLREAGIDVEVMSDPGARALDPGYFHHRETGIPLVILKYAMTLDGSAAATDRSSQWVTGEEARIDAQVLRSEVDGVVVGAGTVVTDDPRLDVRLAGYEGPQPRPVIIAGNSPLPNRARIWERRPLVVSTRERPIPAGDLLLVDGEGHPDPRAACAALSEVGLLYLLLEGGPRLAASWWHTGVIGRGVIYIGSRVGGGGGIPPLAGVFRTIDDATEVVVTGARQVGSDIRVDFETGV